MLAGLRLPKDVSPVSPRYPLVDKGSWHHGEEDINRLRGEAIANNGVKYRWLDFIKIAALGWLILEVDRVCLILYDRWWRRWYQRLVEIMKLLGFSRCDVDQAVFF